MDVVTHDAEIVDGERMLLFQPFDVGKKKRAHGHFVENHLSAVDFSRDMVDGILYQISLFSHTLYMAKNGVLLG